MRQHSWDQYKLLTFKTIRNHNLTPPLPTLIFYRPLPLPSLPHKIRIIPLPPLPFLSSNRFLALFPSSTSFEGEANLYGITIIGNKFNTDHAMVSWTFLGVSSGFDEFFPSSTSVKGEASLHNITTIASAA